MTRTFLYRFEGDILVCAHSDEPPAHDEWEAMVDRVSRLGADSLRAFILTDSVGPDARQRAALKRIPCAARLRQAVLTPSYVVRGIATALSWLQFPVQAFAPRDVDGAVRFLGMTAGERIAAVRTLADLRAQLAGAGTLASAARTLHIDTERCAALLFETPLHRLKTMIRTPLPRSGDDRQSTTSME